MKLLFLGLGIAVAPVVCLARLGETEPQLVQRFGEPSSRQPDRIIAQGKFVEIGTLLRFRQDAWSITSHLIEQRCAKETYSKPGEWTNDQITLVLTSNAQGAKWTETGAGSKLRREWLRGDGATAVWQLGQGITVTHPAYLLAKRRAEEKAKADAGRLPKI